MYKRFNGKTISGNDGSFRAINKLKKGEKIIADAILSHGFTHHVVILNRNNIIIQRRYHHTGKEWDGSGAKLLNKRGRYREINNSFRENYRIHKGMLELHDKDGLITKGKIIKR